MHRTDYERLDGELKDHLSSLLSDMGRPERVHAMEMYARGLLLDGERKSIQPMAMRLVEDPAHAEALRQALQQCVVHSDWSDAVLRCRIAYKVQAEMPGVEALIIDDTGFPKKGEHSVGVARQYSGTLGRVENCQVATSLHLGGEVSSALIALRLYLPKEWAEDLPRRRKAGVPDDVNFQTKWQIALDLLHDAQEWGVAKLPVLADSGYGDGFEFRAELTSRGFQYVVGVSSEMVVWAPGTGPIAPQERIPSRLGGRPLTRFVDGDIPPVSIADLAKAQGRKACRTVHWREGSRGRQGSRFGAIRVRTAHRHRQGHPPGEEQWLLYEWPSDEPEPMKFWLSTLPADTPVKRLVFLAKLRWRVERDYQEMKQELGLDHFEGRTWRGFHHHATLCALAHSFLALRRALFPPEPRSLDAAAGEGTPAVPVAPQHRSLSAVLQNRRRSRATDGAVDNVIK